MKRKHSNPATRAPIRRSKGKGSIRVGAKQKRRNPGKRFGVVTDNGDLLRTYATKAEAERYAKQVRHGASKLNVKVKDLHRDNPAAESIEAYRDFHGEDPKEMVTVTTKVHFHRHLAGAGELKYLVVDTPDGKYRVTIKFKKDVLLAFNEKRNQLFVEGGDQSVKLEDFGIDPDHAHELETLGHASRIGYFTTKVHLRKEDGGTAVYDHKFRMTNENGQHVTVRVAKYPDVIYRVLDQHLEFSGGSYKILSEGIDQ